MFLSNNNYHHSNILEMTHHPSMLSMRWTQCIMRMNLSFLLLLLHLDSLRSILFFFIQMFRFMNISLAIEDHLPIANESIVRFIISAPAYLCTQSGIRKEKRGSLVHIPCKKTKSILLVIFWVSLKQIQHTSSFLYFFFS